MKGQTFQELVALVDRLRGPEGCPWDREQTFESLKPLLLEEAYETLEALDSGDRAAICNELGDLLFQVVFLSQMAESEGAFDIDEVAQGVIGKMVRRHPHVFGEVKAESAERVLHQWESIKRRERADGSPGGSREDSILDHLPRLPALLTALKISGKASRVGFDWPHIDGVVEKLEEEIGELRQALDSPSGERRDRIEQEVGDLLFGAVNIARFLDIDPETALRKSNRKFVQAISVHGGCSSASAGKDLGDSTLGRDGTALGAGQEGPVTSGASGPSGAEGRLTDGAAGPMDGAYPPAMAGMIDSSSFSVTGVWRFSRKRMSSSLRKILTKRRTFPSDSQMRSLSPGYCLSMSSMISSTDPPVAVITS